MAKAAGFILESLRSIAFLMIGLLLLGAVERPMFRDGALNIVEMLVLLAADLMILYVIHRNMLGTRRFYRAAEKPKLSGLQTKLMLGAAIAAIFILNIW